MTTRRGRSAGTRRFWFAFVASGLTFLALYGVGAWGWFAVVEPEWLRRVLRIIVLAAILGIVLRVVAVIAEAKWQRAE